MDYSITDEEYNSISSRVIDIVTTPYAYPTGPHFNKTAFNYYCWRFDNASLYDPCDYVICENVCSVYDLWSQKCVEGLCVDDELIEQNSNTCGYTIPDPCDGVVCDPVCIEHELWTQKCIDGSCVDNIMIEQNSPMCGYVYPDEPDLHDLIIDNWGYIPLLIFVGVAIGRVLE